MDYNVIKEQWLIKHNIKQSEILSILSQLEKPRLDYGDLYFQSSYHETWVLENRMIKNSFYNIDQGVGVRAITGEKIGFSYTNEIKKNKLIECVKFAGNIVAQPGKLPIANSKVERNNFNYPVTAINHYYTDLDPIKSFTNEEKIAILHRIDTIARLEDPRVHDVTATLSGGYDQIFIYATDGTLAMDIRPSVQLSISVLVEESGKRECGSSGLGGRFNYDFFLGKEKGKGYINAEYWAREAVRIALVNLSAIAAPAGMLPVVLGSGWPGVLLHEAVGHGLEGDFIRRNTSIYSGKIGEQVASTLCTVVDDGTCLGLRGSLNIDDEGVPGQYNILIEKGILKGYMHDKLSARMLGMQPTGNGRRESYAHLPMPRMTNTYMLAGNSTTTEIIDSIEEGLFAPNLAGGQVDITSGNFVFSTAEAWLIEKGRITKPVKGATIIGSGSEVMHKISMVGNDLVINKGLGICNKDGQNIPVGIGQPTLKIDSITVGGTAIN
ncbi:MAG: metalloprotease TldD [Candidatus Dasytiphilus stammeri]